MRFPDELFPEKVSAALAVRRLRLFSNGASEAVASSAAGAGMVSNSASEHPARARDASDAAFASADPVHRRFEQHAARRPQEIAAVCGTQKVTYSELNSRANRLARYLRRITASPATLVGIFLEPCIGTLVCLLAALKAGNPYIPLDPETAPAQTAAILAETEALILLPSESTPACLPVRRARAISIESEIDSMEHGSSTNLLPRHATDEMACAAFHAFAAGQKGPAVSHHACLNAIDSLRAALRLTPADWFVATMQPDLALLGLWVLAPLVYGARLIFAPSNEEEASDFPFDQIERSRAVVLQATPRIATALLSTGGQVRARLKLICGTDSWPVELLTKLDSMGVEVWQLQGSPADYQVLRIHPGPNGAASHATAHGTPS
jgi:non-ribosomal peptide synthetase component F